MAKYTYDAPGWIMDDGTVSSVREAFPSVLLIPCALPFSIGKSIRERARPGQTGRVLSPCVRRCANIRLFFFFFLLGLQHKFVVARNEARYGLGRCQRRVDIEVHGIHRVHGFNV